MKLCKFGFSEVKVQYVYDEVRVQFRCTEVRLQFGRSEVRAQIWHSEVGVYFQKIEESGFSEMIVTGVVLMGLG